MALDSLRRQDLEEPFEVIVVDSGRDGCGAFVARCYPEVHVVRSETRLWPAGARNRGIDASRGRYVAFLPDDCAARPDWLRRRLAVHRQGVEAVGGAVTNGTPRSVIGTASYLLEYAAVMPSMSVLERQGVPHGLSFARGVFARVGRYPEDMEMGEDTVFNRRCLAEGVRVAFDPEIAIEHRNPTRLRPFLAHQFGHGRGLVRCSLEYGIYPGLAAALRRGGLHAALELFVRYPLGRFAAETRCVARGRPDWLPRLAILSPLVAAGVLATAVGAWSEWRSPG